MTEENERWRPTLVVYDPLKAGSIDGTDTIPHDRAIIRAMNAKYKPNSELRSDPECTVFVGRLSKNTVESDLKDYFKKFGEIISVNLIRDIVTGFSKCYGFIEFAERRDARDAQRANGTRIDEREILVEMECGRTMKGWIPRRLGGGFSGKKESGQLRFGGNQRPFKRPFSMMNKPMDEFGTPYTGSASVHSDRDHSNRRTETHSRFNPPPTGGSFRNDQRPRGHFDGRPSRGRGFKRDFNDRPSRGGSFRRDSRSQYVDRRN